MIVKAMRIDEFTQETERSISARTLRNANMGRGNENLQRQVGGRIDGTSVEEEGI